MIERLRHLQVFLSELWLPLGEVGDRAGHLEAAVDGVVALGVPLR